jgi:gliding motility-associated-like protein
VNVILKIPTAFTPYEIDGYNDIFMERHALTIFDRYGQKVFEGDNGWNGTKGGKLADPGVYFYVVTMTDGSQRKGTIEVVYLND